MRITFLAHFPGRGGSNALLLQLQRFLGGRGHEIAIVVGEDAAEPVLTDYIVARAAGRSWVEQVAALRAAIERTRPDIVYSISGWPELDVLRFLRVPRVRHVFSLERHEYADAPYCMAQVAGFCELFTANTPDVLESVRASAPAGFRGSLAPYRFGDARLHAPDVREQPDTDRKRPIEVCFVGRLDRFQKRVTWLPEIVRRCRQAGADLRWHIYGDGPGAGDVQAALRRGGDADIVTFHGWLAEADLMARLPAHDIFFLCSRWEGLPAAMVEAMFCGLACVAPDMPGGIRYALEQGGGWIYSARSPRAAAAALLAAVRNPLELWRQRAAAQRIARERFSGAAADAALARLDEALRALEFNGCSLPSDSAGPFRMVRPAALWKRRLMRVLAGPAACRRDGLPVLRR